MAWLALFPITSVDAYYHLATGKRILDEGGIPTRGVGSATFGAAPWHDNEWGFQVLAALVGRSRVDADGVTVLTGAGRAGLILLRAGCLAATLALVAFQLAFAGVAPERRAAAVVLLAFLTFGNLFWDVRPQILSYLAFAALLALLARARSGAAWALPATLGVIALWSNVHGAFVLGFGLLACEAAAAWWGVLRGPDGARRVALRATATLAGAPFAACLNPMGAAQLVHPFLYMTRPEITAGNNDWARPDLLHLPLLVATAATFGAAVLRGARPPVVTWVRLALFAALFATAIRHLPIFALVLVPAAAEAVESAWGRKGKAGGWTLAGAVAIVVALSGAKFVSAIPSFTERPSRPLPEAEARFVVRHAVAGSGFNAYRAGGFLMFRLYPAERVFMDGRNDLYGTFRQTPYNAILGAEPGWERLWDEAVSRYAVGWVLVDRIDPLAAALATRDGWIEVPSAALGAGTDGMVLFLANTPANRSILASSVPAGR